jgi:hypothetical protein
MLRCVWYNDQVKIMTHRKSLYHRHVNSIPASTVRPLAKGQIGPIQDRRNRRDKPFRLVSVLVAARPDVRLTVLAVHSRHFAPRSAGFSAGLARGWSLGAAGDVC